MQLLPDNNENIKNQILLRDNYTQNYKEIIKRYIADGSARDDTMITYFSHIEQFIRWCNQEGYQPLNVNKNIIIDYRNELVQTLGHATIALKLSCIRRFYDIALARNIIAENPAKGVRAPKNRNADNITGAKYIPAGKLEFLFSMIPKKGQTDKETQTFARTKAIVALMALQGLRTVEVHRLSYEDIDFDKGLLLVRGKGRDRYIAPREDVLAIIKEYLSVRTYISDNQDKLGIPVFTSISNNHTGKRLSRCAIRDVVDELFIKAGIREKGDKSGKSCHLLRHTTGALLYQATHDLLVVQRELGHADPKTTSRYAHIQNILSERYTKAIPVNPI